MEQVILVTAVVGAVEFVRRAFDHDWMAAVTIAVAALVGWLLGGEFGLTGVEGAVVGLGASGLITVAQKV